MEIKTVAIIIVILIFLLWSPYDIGGFWVASEQFLKDAGLKSMVLFIDEGHTFSSMRNGYLHAANTSGEVENQKIELSVGQMINGWSSLTVNGSNNWDGIGLQMRICTKKNLMTILDGETVYGEFYKDNAASDAA